jgi:CBS domain containing-hemolysin-like protein
VQGIASIEDVLAELFGEIGDELKHPELGAEELPDGTVLLPGSMRLDEVEPWIGVAWEGTSATVGGHIVNALGRLPEEGEHLEIDGVEVTIHAMSPTAVRQVLAQPWRPTDDDESEDARHSEASKPEGEER